MSDSDQAHPEKAKRDARAVARPILVRRDVPAEGPAENQPIAPRAEPPIANPTPTAPTAPVQPRSTIAAKPVLTTQRRSKLINAPPEEEFEEEFTEIAIKNAPPWLVSLIVHTVILIGLGLLMLPNFLDSQLQLEVVYAEKLGDQIEEAVLQSPVDSIPELEEPVLSEDDMPVEDPLAAPPDIVAVEVATNQSSEIAAPSIGLALSGREAGMKKALLATYGGTATTEDAVVRGLEWLKRNQHRDGMWSLTGPYRDGSPTENRTAATAMALLAFQGHGSTHQYGPYRDVVSRAWTALLKKQDAEGNFFLTGGHHHRLYTHAQATIALCELYGMTKDEALKEPAQKALKYCYSSQSPQGGWRYAPGGASDTSVTGWFVMALQSGRMAGLSVPRTNLEKISAYLDTATVDGGSRYAYIPGQTDSLSMTAEGLLCRQYLGWERNDPRLVEGMNYVVGNTIHFGDMNVYYWYYATQATHHMGGEHWTEWNKVMRQSIPEEQVQTGTEKGSWEPGRDSHGHLGGRLYTTCLCIYMLEVYYRHLPIYKHTLK